MIDFAGAPKGNRTPVLTYPTAWPDEQFPVEALSDFGNQVIPDLNATLPTPNPTYENLAQVAVLAGGAVVVRHSESGFFPEQAALVNSSGVKGIISIEGQCPTLNAGQIHTLAKILNQTLFCSLAHARMMLAAWRDDYNVRRPHSGLGWRTPAEYAATFNRNGRGRCARWQAPRPRPLSSPLKKSINNCRSYFPAG